jgi:hypothetical protein
MIKHLWSILAEKTSVDQQTNNLSILGVLEELTLQAPDEIKFPVTLPVRHTIVSFWQKTKWRKKPISS